MEGAHGYQIWRQEDDGSFRIVKIIGAREEEQALGQCEETAYSNTGLEAGKEYVYRMRAYMFREGNVVYGAYSDDISVAVMLEKSAARGQQSQRGTCIAGVECGKRRAGISDLEVRE